MSRKDLELARGQAAASCSLPNIQRPIDSLAQATQKLRTYTPCPCLKKGNARKSLSEYEAALLEQKSLIQVSHAAQKEAYLAERRRTAGKAEDSKHGSRGPQISVQEFLALRSHKADKNPQSLHTRAEINTRASKQLF